MNASTPTNPTEAAEHVVIGNCPTCSHFPTQFVGDGERVDEYRAIRAAPSADVQGEPVEIGELTPERIEHIAGAIAAAWCKGDMQVRAKRCALAAAALRELNKRATPPQPAGAVDDAAVERALHAWFGRDGEELCIANYKLAQTENGRALPDRMRAALEAARIGGVVAPDGFVLVPAKATDAMCESVDTIVSTYAAAKIWERMTLAGLLEAPPSDAPGEA